MQFPSFPPTATQITLPSGKQIPTFWTGPSTRLQWEGAGNADYKDDGTDDGRYARWDSPVFDLRPQFEDQQGQGADQGRQLGTYPIFAPGGSLYVFANILTPNAATFLDLLNISVWEVAHPFNPYAARPITSESNVTTVYTSGIQPYGLVSDPSQGVSGLGIFTPPMGASGPVRFWRLRMIWRRHDNLPDPTVHVSASFY